MHNLFAKTNSLLTIFNARTIDLDLNPLPSGIYIVHFYSENGAAVSIKVIKI